MVSVNQKIKVEFVTLPSNKEFLGKNMFPQKGKLLQRRCQSSWNNHNCQFNCDKFSQEEISSLCNSFYDLKD